MTSPEELVACPACGVRTLVLRNGFDRITVSDLRARYPKHTDHLAGLADDRLIAVARPELACQTCGATFDGSKEPPR
jgi:hypothetical protein